MQANTSDSRLAKWFETDYLIQRAGIFALGGIQGEARLQTPTSHRGVILMKDTYIQDEFGTGFGEIGVKGTGLTHNGLDHYEKHYVGSDPLGFFGYKHAMQEMRLSDEFAEFGGRGGRVIGVITLNPDALKQWATKKSPNWDTYYQVGQMIDKVTATKDTPALCVRLMGTDRVMDASRTRSTGYYSPHRIHARAARLLLREMQREGTDEFLTKYKIDTKFPIESDLESLSRSDMSSYSDPFRPELKSLAFLQRYFLYWNYSHFKKLSDSRHHGTLTFKGSAQDIDMVGHFYDWETSLWNDSQYYSERENDDFVEIHKKAQMFLNDESAHREVRSEVFQAARKAGVVR